LYKKKNILNTKDTKGKPLAFIRITLSTLCPSCLKPFWFRLVRVRNLEVKSLFFVQEFLNRQAREERKEKSG
jgi:hypothetical protein